MLAPVWVEEPDLDGVGITGGEAHVIPPRALPLRTWKRVRGTVAKLDVLHVDAGEVHTTDEGPLQRPCDPAGVTADGDGGALLECSAVSRRDPDRDLRRDVDVGQPQIPAGRGCGRRGSPTRSTS